MHFQLLVYGNIKEYDDKSLQECHKKNTVKTVKYKSRTSHSFNVASTFQNTRHYCKTFKRLYMRYSTLGCIINITCLNNFPRALE